MKPEDEKKSHSPERKRLLQELEEAEWDQDIRDFILDPSAVSSVESSVASSDDSLDPDETSEVVEAA